MRIVPLVGIFLMYLWGEVNPRSSYSTLLTALSSLFVLCVVSEIAFPPHVYTFIPYLFLGMPFLLLSLIIEIQLIFSAWFVKFSLTSHLEAILPLFSFLYNFIALYNIYQILFLL